MSGIFLSVLGLPMGEREAQAISTAAAGPLVEWYRKNARQLPWRETKDPYAIWVSEVMLQQTRVETVKPYYRRFLAALPDIAALAAAPEGQLMKLWEGLGYYSRARNLQKAAQQVMERHGGSLPPSYGLLLDLAGFGEYTAGAVASIAFGIPVPAVDGNVLRVFSRLLAAEGDISSPNIRKGYRQLLLETMPQGCPGDYNQALMELGATLCGPKGLPGCLACPLNRLCRACGQGSPGAYPVKSPKKPRRVEERTVFLPATSEGVLLQKRPETGLLAGLWGFPSVEGRLSREEQERHFRQWGDFQEIRLLGEARHIFTHVEWRMEGALALYRALTPGQGQILANWAELEKVYAVPSAFAPFRARLLAELGGEAPQYP